MKTPLIFLALFLTLLSPCFAAPILSINPGTFSVHMSAGETIYKTISVEAEGFGEEIIAYLDYSARAINTNLDGFEISLSDTNLTFENDGIKDVILEISTSPVLAPDTFEIELTATANVESRKHGSSGSRSIVYEDEEKNCTNTTITKKYYVPYFINSTLEKTSYENQTCEIGETDYESEIARLEKSNSELKQFVMILITTIFLILFMAWIWHIGNERQKTVALDVN